MAAAEYTAEVSGRARQIYEKTPYCLQRTESGAAQNKLALVDPSRKVGVLQHAAGAVNAVRRDFETLDRERQEVQQQLRSNEAFAVAAWVADLTGCDTVQVAVDEGDVVALHAALRSGVVLCELANSVAKAAGDTIIPVPAYVQRPSNVFRCIDNVTLFVKACREHFGIPGHQLFDPHDLCHKNGDMWVVVRCILALGGRAQVMYPSYAGPVLGIADLTSARRTSALDPAQGASGAIADAGGDAKTKPATDEALQEEAAAFVESAVNISDE